MAHLLSKVRIPICKQMFEAKLREQSDLLSRVDSLRSEAEGFSLSVPIMPYDEESVSAFEAEVRLQKNYVEQIRTLEPEAEEFGLKLPTVPYDEESIETLKVEIEERRVLKQEQSLGKKKKGIFPIISTMPKDNHSLMQLYLDGPKNNFFSFFDTREKNSFKLKKNSLQMKSIN